MINDEIIKLLTSVYGYEEINSYDNYRVFMKHTKNVILGIDYMSYRFVDKDTGAFYLGSTPNVDFSIPLLGDDKVKYLEQLKDGIN